MYLLMLLLLSFSLSLKAMEKSQHKTDEESQKIIWQDDRDPITEFPSPPRKIIKRNWWKVDDPIEEYPSQKIRRRYELFFEEKPQEKLRKKKTRVQRRVEGVKAPKYELKFVEKPREEKCKKIPKYTKTSRKKYELIFIVKEIKLSRKKRKHKRENEN